MNTRELCPPCESGYCSDCRLASGQWDMPGSCRCDCLDEMPPQVKCAWCGYVMSPGSHPISHSCCPACMSKNFPEVTLEAKGN